MVMKCNPMNSYKTRGIHFDFLEFATISHFSWDRQTQLSIPISLILLEKKTRNKTNEKGTLPNQIIFNIAFHVLGIHLIYRNQPLSISEIDSVLSFLLFSLFIKSDDLICKRIESQRPNISDAHDSTSLENETKWMFEHVWEDSIFEIGKTTARSLLTLRGNLTDENNSSFSSESFNKNETSYRKTIILFHLSTSLGIASITSILYNKPSTNYICLKKSFITNYGLEALLLFSCYEHFIHLIESHQVDQFEKQTAYIKIIASEALKWIPLKDFQILSSIRLRFQRKQLSSRNANQKQVADRNKILLSEIRAPKNKICVIIDNALNEWIKKKSYSKESLERKHRTQSQLKTSNINKIKQESKVLGIHKVLEIASKTAREERSEYRAKSKENCDLMPNQAISTMDSFRMKNTTTSIDISKDDKDEIDNILRYLASPKYNNDNEISRDKNVKIETESQRKKRLQTENILRDQIQKTKKDKRDANEIEHLKTIKKQDDARLAQLKKEQIQKQERDNQWVQSRKRQLRKSEMIKKMKEEERDKEMLSMFERRILAKEKTQIRRQMQKREEDARYITIEMEKLEKWKIENENKKMKFEDEKMRSILQSEHQLHIEKEQDNNKKIEKESFQEKKNAIVKRLGWGLWVKVEGIAKFRDGRKM